MSRFEGLRALIFIRPPCRRVKISGGMYSMSVTMMKRLRVTHELASQVTAAAAASMSLLYTCKMAVCERSAECLCAWQAAIQRAQLC